MKITVTSISRSDAVSADVAFESRHGSGVAKWDSSVVAPSVGKEFDVEFDVDVKLSSANTIKIMPTNVSIASAEGGVVLLRGLIDSVDEDGVACLRLGVDCLVIVDAEDGFASGDVVEMRVPDRGLLITPIGDTI